MKKLKKKKNIILSVVHRMKKMHFCEQEKKKTHFSQLNEILMV